MGVDYGLAVKVSVVGGQYSTLNIKETLTIKDSNKYLKFNLWYIHAYCIQFNDFQKVSFIIYQIICTEILHELLSEN